MVENLPRSVMPLSYTIYVTCMLLTLFSELNNLLSGERVCVPYNKVVKTLWVNWKQHECAEGNSHNPLQLLYRHYNFANN